MYEAYKQTHREAFDLFRNLLCAQTELLTGGIVELQRKRRPIDLVVVASQDTDQATADVAHHRSTDAALKAGDGSFVVAGLHIRYRDRQLMFQLRSRVFRVGFEHIQNVAVVCESLLDVGNETRQFILDPLTLRADSLAYAFYLHLVENDCEN